jgi:type IV pilus assembly protein PilQ
MKSSIHPVNYLIHIVFALLFMCVSSAQAADADNAIVSIKASPSVNGKVVLTVALKNAPLNPPAAFIINSPARIAFDFLNTSNALGKSSLDLPEGDLRSVNIIQAGTRTRLVVNLAQMLTYETRVDGANLLITLQNKEAVSAGDEPQTSARFAEPRLGSQTHSLLDVDFRRGSNGEGRIQIDMSDASVGIDIKQQGKVLIVEFAKTKLPANLQRKLDVIDFGTPVQMIDAFVQGDNARLLIEPRGNWEYSAYQTDNKFIIEVKPVVEDPTKTARNGRIAFAGEKLSFNFQNISTREALNVIADFTNLNMVISDSVTGNMTLRLKDVPWDQALQIILDSRALMQVRDGNVITVAPRDEIAARQKDLLTNQSIIHQLEPVHTESFQLNYAKVEDVKAVLAGYQNTESTDSASSSSNGSTAPAAGASATTSTNTRTDRSEKIAFDSRTNTMYVTATSSRLVEVREIIKKLDVPVRQVLIEARFVSATRTFNSALGGRLGLSQTGQTAIGGGGVTGQVTNMSNVNLPGFPAAAGNLSLSLFDQLATKTLTLELAASELDERIKSIASPRVMTGDGTPATIKSGVQIPYAVAGSSTSGPSIAFKDATLSLKVTPRITPDNRVTMILDLTQDSVGTLYGGVPSINKKQVLTTVMVENGGTVVIGGVFTQDTLDSTSRVPWLGDIPGLGWLFKSRARNDTKQELLIFITPKILKDSLNIN